MTGTVKPAEGPDLKPDGPCKAALDRLCAHVRQGSGQKAHCLRQKVVAATNRQESSPVTPDCKLQMAKFFIHGLQSGSLEPVSGFNAACKDDIEKYCGGKKGRVVQCLKNVSSKLQPRCFYQMMEVRIF
eukprot:CAMPEP_0172761920 /NCGR_PEP_ID=MMETSP1074-20121228/172477_1 /TAXON_ID=2916 /ORGANISM="Ceratium fusus, Strain PA161109" /LENGTH=128 /DNA_ID=CAMNT_0013596221 /DNA_START=38 /DNA_END=421 /DNA_ORIENTATION=-